MRTKNLEPKSNTEYIYNLDMIWTMDSHEQKTITERIIVENVKQMEVEGGYCFNIKGENDNYYISNYGWAFIENTNENIELLKQIDLENEILKKQQLKINKPTYALSSLAPTKAW